MPYSTNGKRDYKKEKAYQAKAEQKKNRAKRNKARRAAIRSGVASKGDGTEVDHKRPLSKGGSNSKANTRLVSRRTNRRKATK